MADRAGGAARLAEREPVLTDDDLRLACHLVERAAFAEPDNPPCT